MGTADVPHGCCRCASLVLQVCFTGTADVPHMNCRCASQVLHINVELD